MKRIIANLSVLVLVLCIGGGCLPTSAKSNGPILLETGKPAAARPDPAPRSVRIVTFNIRHVGGKELTELGDLLSSDPDLAGAELIGLQEVDRAKRRTGQVNTARALAERLGMYYAWAGQPLRNQDDDEEDTGIALLSSFPLTDVERIELPHVGPRGRRRVALGATVTIGRSAVRVYVVHAERRIPSNEHLDQYRAVVAALSARSEASRAVVLGDLNSHQFVDETEEFFGTAGFNTAVPAAEPTFRVAVMKCRLDWIWTRGLSANGGGVVRRTRLSDHWPVWTTVALGPE